MLFTIFFSNFNILILCTFNCVITISKNHSKSTIQFVNINSSINIVEIQDGIRSNIWWRGFNFDTLAKLWVTKLTCLLTKLILKFGKCCNKTLQLAIILPNSYWLLELSTMLSTTSLQFSSICTFNRPKWPSHDMA